MATFIKGVTDNLGQQDLYTPDYSFLTKAVSEKQSEYDRGFNAFKNVLNSSLNAPLTNVENLKRRQDIFKKIQDSIKSVSGLDLSNQNNVLQAMKILDPLTSDKEIAYDMHVTSQNQKAAQQIESVKNSFDPEVRKMYNQYSEMDINLQADKLRTAKRGDGSIFKVQPGEFVPYENPAELLNKAAKEAGIDIEITQALGNGYLQTIKNGKIAKDPFTRWAIETMGNRYDRYFNQMGKVQAETGIRSIMSQHGVSREEAEAMTVSQMTKSLLNEAAARGEYSDIKLREYDLKLDLFRQNAAKNSGKVVNSKAYDKLLAERNNYLQELAESQTDLETLRTQGPDYVARNLGAIISNSAKKKAANDWAVSRADATAKVELKADEVVLKKWQLAQDESQFQRSMAFKEKELDFRIKDASVKNQLSMLKLQADGKAPSTEYIGQVDGTTVPAVQNLQDATFALKDDIYNKTFGAENGLMSLVYSNPEKFNRMSSTVNKLLTSLKTGNLKFNSEDQANLNTMFKDLGMPAYDFDPSKRSSADGLLKRLSVAITKRAGNNIQDLLDSGGAKDGRLAARIKAFQSVQSNVSTLLQKQEQLDKSNDAISDAVTSRPGFVKGMYNGATVIGVTSSGKPLYDLSKVSEDGKKFLSNMVDQQFNTGAVTSTQYKFNKLSGSELMNIIRSKPDNEGLSAQLKNIPAASVSKLFSDEAIVTYNPANKTVTYTLKPNINSGEAKKLALDKGGSFNFTMTYDEAQAVSSERLRSGIVANTQNNTALGISSELYNNPAGKMHSPSYMDKVGYTFNIQGTTNENGEYGVNVAIKKKNHLSGKWVQAESFFYKMNPKDKSALAHLENKINDNFYNYIEQIESYTKSVINSEDVLPINYNE